MPGSLIDSSGPFPIYDRPAAFPWADLVNGVGEKPVFDLGVDLDTKDGVAYIQIDHVIAMARTLGMVTREEHEEVLSAMTELKESTPESETERLSNVIRDLDSFVRDRLAIADPISDVPVENSAEPESTPEGNADNSGDSNQPALFQGPDELSGSTGNDNSFGFDGLESASGRSAGKDS